MFASTRDSRSPVELDFGAAPPDMPEAEVKVVPKTSEPEPAKYSPIFKLGLLFSVPPSPVSPQLIPV